MKIFFSIILVLILHCGTYSQKMALTGVVLDNNSLPLEYVKISLLKKMDSINVCYTTTNSEGKYFFEINKGKYILEYDYFSELIYKNIDISNDTIIEKIFFEENSNIIEEISIQGKKPTITRKSDRLIFNIENSILSKGNSWDAIKKSPGVITSLDGEIQIRSSSDVIVMLNDRPIKVTGSELKTILEGMPAYNISSIEIITSPPARYEAQGGALINIKTRGKIRKGYNIGIQSNSKLAKYYPKYSNGISYDLNSEKLNFNSFYNFDNGKKKTIGKNSINYLDLNNIKSIWIEKNNFFSDYKNHNFLISTDYLISEKTKIGVLINGIIPESDKVDTTFTDIYNTNNIIDSLLNNINIGFNNSKNKSYNINFSNENDNRLITGDFNYTDYDNNQNDVINTYYLSNIGVVNNSSVFTTKSKQRINIYSGQLDFSFPHKKGIVETGLKLYDLNNKNKYDFFDEESILDNDRSNQFYYNETNYAGYLSYELNNKKQFSFKIGLRAEYILRKGNSIPLNQVEKKTNFQLFPSINGSYEINDDNQVGLSYSRRINRPSYNFLNPARTYFSPYSYTQGTPSLNSSLTNNIEFTYDISNKYYFSAYYKNILNPISQISFQNNTTNEIMFLATNTKSYSAFGLNFNTTFNIFKFWEFYLDLEGFFSGNTFKHPITQIEYKNDGFSYDLYTYNSFIISEKGNTSVEVQAYYFSKRYKNTFNIDYQYEISLGLQKKFLNDKCILTLELSDIINTNQTILTSEYGDQNNNYLEKPETQTLRISFSYNFGNHKTESKKKIKSEEEKRI